jgi:hypothetical protein
MADGLADRLDRLAAVGNGQVPAVVKLAWNTLISVTPEILKPSEKALF